MKTENTNKFSWSFLLKVLVAVLTALAVGGVTSSHHIVGCAADIVASPSPSQGGGPSSAVSESPLLGRGRGEANLSLFHLIVQMQREGAIRFTQLIAEKDYRWLHISYVPGMLRNQVIDVNDTS